VSNIQPLPGEIGWEGGYQDTNLTPGAWWAGVADLGEIKGAGRVGDALDLFDAPGVYTYLRCLISEVPPSGEWRIEKQLGGSWRDFDFAIEPENAPLPGSTRDGPHVPHAIVPWHKSKWGNEVTTAQACLIPRPTAACLGVSGNFLGFVYGQHEVDHLTGKVTKIFDAAAVHAVSGQTAFVVTDEVIGYASDGTTDLLNAQTAGGIWQATADGVIDEIHWWGDTSIDATVQAGTYDAAAASPPGIVGSTLKTNGQAPNKALLAADPIADIQVDYVTKPSISAGDDVVFGWRSNVVGARQRYATASGFEVSFSNSPGSLQSTWPTGYWPWHSERNLKWQN
jgi:hypothetical protein